MPSRAAITLHTLPARARQSPYNQTAWLCKKSRHKASLNKYTLSTTRRTPLIQRKKCYFSFYAISRKKNSTIFTLLCHVTSKENTTIEQNCSPRPGSAPVDLQIPPRSPPQLPSFYPATENLQYVSF